MINCDLKDKNIEGCNCTYANCPRKGACCACIAYHRSMGELVACYFDEETEKTFDRSVENFIGMHKERKGIKVERI